MDLVSVLKPLFSNVHAWEWQSFGQLMHNQHQCLRATLLRNGKPLAQVDFEVPIETNQCLSSVKCISWVADKNYMVKRHIMVPLQNAAFPKDVLLLTWLKQVLYPDLDRVQSLIELVDS